MCQDRATTNMAYLVFTQPCMHSEHGSLYGVRGIRFLAILSFIFQQIETEKDLF